MNPYITKLKQELTQYEAACGRDTSESILEQLFSCYSFSAPVDDGRILESERALLPVFEALPGSLSDLLFDRISDLALSYQRAAFLEGLRVGYRITEELGNTDIPM